MTGTSCYKLDTNLTSHLPALLSGGKQRVGNEGVKLSLGTKGGVLGFVLVSHHTSILISNKLIFLKSSLFRPLSK